MIWLFQHQENEIIVEEFASEFWDLILDRAIDYLRKEFEISEKRFDDIRKSLSTQGEYKYFNHTFTLREIQFF
jgi:hypothetical protein